MTGPRLFALGMSMLFGLWVVPVFSQGRPRVYRDQVEPHWFAGGDQFWYSNRLSGGRSEYILVDAVKGERKRLFDAGKLAAALRQAGVEQVDAERLVLTDLRITDDGRWLVFRYQGKSWRWDRQEESLRPGDQEPQQDQTTVEELPRRTRRTGEEIDVVFINRLGEPVELFWVDSEGTPRSYGRLEPGGERRQRTFDGHVWWVRDGQGRLVHAVTASADQTQIEIRRDARRLNPPAGDRFRPSGRWSPRSPDGRWEAFIRDANIWIRDRRDGGEFALSDNGTAGDSYRPPIIWSPDSQYVAVIQEVAVEKRRIPYVESSPPGELHPKLHQREYVKPGDPLPRPRPRIFHVPTKQAVPLDETLISNPWSVERFRWSPDSARFTFLYNQRGHQVLRLVTVDVTQGTTRVLLEERSDTFIDYAHKLYLRWLDDTEEFLWMSERSGWNHLYLYDGRTGELKSQVTQGSWLVRSVERIDEQRRELILRVMGCYPDQDPYHIHYARVRLDGTHFTMLTEDDGTHSVQFSPDGRFFIDTWSRVDRPPVNQLRRTEDGQLICLLEEADVEELLMSGFRTPERFVAKGRDGTTDIWGIIYRPRHLVQGKRYPILEEVYAGPQSFYVPKAFHTFSRLQQLADEGYIVVKIDGMGTNWRSKRFHDVCWKNLADAGFPDRIAWIRAAAEKYPEMDIGRVGIFGTSAGGQSAMRALIDYGDFYRAAVADCGCHDNRMDKIWWNELWMGWPVGPQYEASSNVVHAHRLQGKLLLAVGEMDTNVDPASTMQVVDALIRADKDFELLVVPGAGHGVMRGGYGWRRLRDFFRRTLEPESIAPE